MSDLDLAADITNNLKEILAERDIFGTDLADNAKLPNSTVYRAMEGKQIPSLPTLVAMAKAMGVTLDRIVFGKEAANASAVAKGKRANQDRRRHSDRNRKGGR